MDLHLDTLSWHHSSEYSPMYTCIKLWTCSCIHYHFCWLFPVWVLSKFLWLFASIRAVFIIYPQGLVLLSWNTFHLHSLSSLAPFVTCLMCYLHSIYYILPSRPTQNAIMWLPCDCTNPTHQTLRTRLTPKNPARMSYHMTMHNMSCSFNLHQRVTLTQAWINLI